MKRTYSLTFERAVDSILDVDLTKLAQLMKQQGFELTNVHSCSFADFGAAINGGSGSEQRAQSAPSETPQPDAAAVPADKTAKTTRTKAAKTTEPAADAAAAAQTTEAQIEGAPAPAKTQDKKTRSEEGTAKEAELRGILVPASNDPTIGIDKVNAFVLNLGYERISYIPDSELPAAITAAKREFKKD